MCLADNVEHFSLNYSYPLPLHNRLSPELRLQKWDDITSIHYFNLFFYNDWNIQIRKLKKFNINSNKYKWLSQEVIRLNMPRTSVLHRYMLAIRRIEAKTTKIQYKN